jgi:hypothetical protein
MRKITIAAWLVLLLAGCQSKPIYRGPNYSLNEFPDQAVVGPVAVDFVDARPFWEKRYYEGGTAFVPLENLRPSPLPLLTEEIQREARCLPTPPNRVIVKLSSFRIVMRDNKQEEADKAVAEKQQQELDDAEPSEIFGTIVGIVMEGCVRTIIEECRLNIEEWKQKELHLQGPPRQLDGHYELGVSCEIRAVASLEWSNGQRRDVPLRALVAGEELTPDTGVPYGKNNNVRAAVFAACSQIAAECKQGILQPNATAEKPHEAPNPQFTAYSGK